MNNAGRALKNVNEIEYNRESYVLPQHILKLARKIIKSDSKIEIEKSLKLLYSYTKYDNTLLEIFNLLGWQDEYKKFEKGIEVNELKKKLEEGYEFKLEDIKEGETLTTGSLKLNSKINEHGTDSTPSNNINNLIINNNSNLSLFNTNKNDPSLDLFSVCKPVPMSNFQGDRNIGSYDLHLDGFLTNSAKAWNQQNIEDDSSIISNWQKSSNGKLPNKTPSFNHDENPNLTSDENFTFNKNSHTNSNLPMIITGAVPSVGQNNTGVSQSPFSHVNTTLQTNKKNTNYKEYLEQIKTPQISDSNFKNLSKSSNLQTSNISSFQSFQPVQYNNGKFFGNKNNNHNSNSNSANFNCINPTFNNNYYNIQYNNNVKNNPPFKSENINTSNNFKITPNPSKVISKTLRRKNKIIKGINLKINKKLKHNKFNPKSKINSKNCNLKNKNSLSLINSMRSSNFGLKEISKKVKEIVKRFKKTTYKQISDFIVDEINEKDIKDEKNIRRRIYDSLNVMKAMNLFKKDATNKFILWNGDNDDIMDDNDLNEDEYNQEFQPKEMNISFKKRKASSNDNSVIEIKHSIDIKKREIQNKTASFIHIDEQFKILNELINRNFEEKSNVKEEEKIRFPFLVIEFPDSRNVKNNINITFNETKSKLHFSLENPINIYGDMDAIKKINSKLSKSQNSQEDKIKINK